MATRFASSSTDDNQRREYLFKVLVIGELATGKTSVVKRYVHNHFSDHYKTTIGVDFALKIVKANDGSVVRLQLWDIAGQERFGNMTRVYYREAVGCIIVFDVTRASTFDAVAKWKVDLDGKVQLADGNRVPCILLANKCDLVKDGLINNAEQMNNYCRENGFDKWFETSAKENNNIDTAIQYLISEIMKHTNDHKPLQGGGGGGGGGGSNVTGLKVTDSQENNSGGGGCCGGKKN